MSAGFNLYRLRPRHFHDGLHYTLLLISLTGRDEMELFYAFSNFAGQLQNSNLNRWEQHALSVTQPEFPLDCFPLPRFMLGPRALIFHLESWLLSWLHFFSATQAPTFPGFLSVLCHSESLT